LFLLALPQAINIQYKNTLNSKSHPTNVILLQNFISLLVEKFDIELSCLVVKFHLKLSHLQVMEATFHWMEWWLRPTQINDLTTNKGTWEIWTTNNLDHPSTWWLALPFQMFEYGKIFKLCNLFFLKQFARHFFWWSNGENSPTKIIQLWRWSIQHEIIVFKLEANILKTCRVKSR
jgi:hypothetical protein